MRARRIGAAQRGRRKARPESSASRFPVDWRQIDIAFTAANLNVMSIALPQQFESYIQRLLKTGHYAQAEEIIAEALLEHRARREQMQVTMTPELERLLDEGLENWDKAVSTDDLRRK